ncbi:uncharacterized protein [Oscarella lobularis]|uniref:uncharacterized protein isoform X4 n=1 Tax=Oscarella lobularis TaxID=121494 RepID=UPI00331312CF
MLRICLITAGVLLLHAVALECAQGNCSLATSCRECISLSSNCSWSFDETSQSSRCRVRGRKSPNCRHLFDSRNRLTEKKAQRNKDSVASLHGSSGESFLCRDSLESVRVSKREESATTTSPPKKSPNYTLILLLICFGLAMLVILGLFAWKIIVTLMDKWKLNRFIRRRERTRFEARNKQVIVSIETSL